MISSSYRRHRAPSAFVAASVVLMIAANASANSGVQLPLSQYQAGAETTSSAPITNANFESADGSGTPTGWTPTSPVMNSGAPDPANPTIPLVTGTRSAQARMTGGINPFDNYFLNQTITLQPNTDYVLSSYIWNYAFAGPNPPTDLFAGDLAVVQLRDPNNFFNTSGMILEPVTRDGGNGNRGVFAYKTFNSSQFSSGTVQLELSFDPNEDLQFGVNRPALSAQWDNVAITPLSGFAAQSFTAVGTGLAWDAPANWVNGPADAIGAVATFNGFINGGDRPLALNGTRTVAIINRHGSGTYVLEGGTLVLDHEEPNDAVMLNNFGGGLEVAAPVVIGVGTMGNPATLVTRNFKLHVEEESELLTVSGPITAATVGTLGTGKYNLIKTGIGRLDLLRVVNVDTLRIEQGRVRMLPGGSPAGASRVESIDIDPNSPTTARLELNNTAMVVDYTGGSPIATIKELIRTAFNNDGPAGNGIASQFSGSIRVGYAEASELGGAIPPIFGSVDGTAILLRGTRAGDANLDAIVNINDFSALGANFNQSGDWIDGDFNFDGLVNITDFSALASNFNRTSPGTIDIPRGAMSGVPEPAAAVALVSLTATGLIQRRYGRRARPLFHVEQ